MLNIKDGQYGARLSPIAAVVAMFMVVDQVLTEFGFHYEVSSGIEGEHSPGSLHYVGMAHDWVIRNPNERMESLKIKEVIKARLGQDFDVLWYPDRYQIHVEFQPKQPYGRID